jgi:autotransporter-associated beta strand protein
MSGGTLNLGGAFYLGAPNILASDAVTLTSFSNAVTSEMAPGGGLVLRGGFGQTNFVFTVARGATNGVDLQVDAAISENGGSCSIIKAGSGTLALDDANSYSGLTVVSNGTLLVNGSTAAGAVIVNTGATVGGAGTIAGSITNNGTLAPGSNSVGTLATGGVTFEPGSTLLFRLSSATNNAEQSLLSVNGTLDLEGLSGGQFTIKLVSMANPNTPGLLPDFNPAASYVWTVAKATGLITNINSLGQLVLDTSGFQNAFPGGFSLGFNVAAAALQITYAPPSLQAPVLSALTTYSAGEFTLMFSGPTGQGYQVLMSTNLALPLADWTVLASGSFGVAPVNYTDTDATNTARFYSIKSP